MIQFCKKTYETTINVNLWLKSWVVAKYAD